MAVRFKPFAHWSPKWGAAAAGTGAAGLAVLALAGQGQAALTLLAAGGARASGALFAAGKLHLELGRRPHRRAPAAGSWRVAIGGGRHQPQGQSSLAERSLSQAAWRLRGGQRPVEARRRPAGDGRGGFPAVLRPPARAPRQRRRSRCRKSRAAQPARLKVSPYPDRASRAEYLVWQIGEAKAAAGSESFGGAIGDLPVPALSIAKDLSVLAASASFEKLFGSSPVGAQAWTLFRTRRGKPFTRAWLRDVIAKAG